MPSPPTQLDAPTDFPAEPPAPLASGLVIGVVLLCLLMALFLSVGVMVQLLNVGFGLWFTEIFLFLGVPWVAVRLSGRLPWRYAGARFPGWRPPAFGFALGAANFFGLVLPLQFLSQKLAPQWLREMFDATLLFNGQTPFELALIVGGVGLAAPFCEEYFFRGVFQGGLLRSSGRPVLTVVVTAALFSAFHLDPVGFPARFELGVLFGLLCWRSGSIWPGVGAHSANNLVSTVIYFLSERSGDAEKDPELAVVLLFTGAGLAVLALLLTLPRRAPRLLAVPEPAEELRAPGPPLPLFRLAGPWLAVALLSVAGLWAVDRRGVQLNLWDLRVRLPALKDEAPPQKKAERKELEALRARVRRGEASMEEYAKARERLLEKKEPKPPLKLPGL